MPGEASTLFRRRTVGPTREVLPKRCTPSGASPRRRGRRPRCATNTEDDPEDKGGKTEEQPLTGEIKQKAEKAAVKKLHGVVGPGPAERIVGAARALVRAPGTRR